MIAKLSGVISDIRPLHVVLDVSGVGYLVAVCLSPQFTLGEKVSFHTHLAVRENALDLYGFLSRDELEMFEHLLKLQKIGPKSAMQIMTQADLELLKKSITSEDPSYLSKMSGIGKKSAEKIVAGLKDIFEYGDGEGAGTAEASDVIDALVALGYTQKSARDALQKLPPDLPDATTQIKEALKIIRS